MAPGGAWLVVVVLLFGLWNRRPPDAARGQDMDEGQVSAPPELVALVPSAAQATVAAGYTGSPDQTPTTAAPAASPVATIIISTQGAPPSNPTFLIVGDTRYAWQEWSEWHCNCRDGSMSRVRDITYSVPGVRLDPVQFDILRFERDVCSYKTCQCSRKEHQCDRLEVACDRGPMHLCALWDIEQDQVRKRHHFWARVHEGLKNLWQSIKETFPSRPKVFQAKSKQ